MTQRRYTHYTYTLTNKASIVLLCVLIVAGGSLFIALGSLRPGEEWVLRAGLVGVGYRVRDPAV